MYCIGLGMNYKYIDSDYVNKIKKNGLEVHPFTVDNEKDMKKLLSWGVDGMFTNDGSFTFNIIGFEKS